MTLFRVWRLRNASISDDGGWVLAAIMARGVSDSSISDGFGRIGPGGRRSTDAGTILSVEGGRPGLTTAGKGGRGGGLSREVGGRGCVPLQILNPRDATNSRLAVFSRRKRARWGRGLDGDWGGDAMQGD